MNDFQIREAQLQDSLDLMEMINQSYRGEHGRSWTTEKYMVDGLRISIDQLNDLLRSHTIKFLVAEIKQDDITCLAGCLALTFSGDHVEIGTYCVANKFQNLGLGQKILAYAEQYATHIEPKLRYYDMYVLDARHELISFYERRGYTKTGETQAYPIAANVGTPNIPIKLIHLQKTVSIKTPA